MSLLIQVNMKRKVTSASGRSMIRIERLIRKLRWKSISRKVLKISNALPKKKYFLLTSRIPKASIKTNSTPKILKKRKRHNIKLTLRKIKCSWKLKNQKKSPNSLLPLINTKTSSFKTKLMRLRSLVRL